jgi:hypothetical protein
MRRVLAPYVAFLSLLALTHLFCLAGVAAALALDIALWHMLLLSSPKAYRFTVYM